MRPMSTLVGCICALAALQAPQNDRPRARDVGIEIGQLPPGEHNAITDVAGVRVGHTTVIEGDDTRCPQGRHPRCPGRLGRGCLGP